MTGRGEPVVLADGHTLVRDGLGERTRRDLDRPRDWQGLTGCDAALLWAWVDGRRERVVELHTDVEIGSVPSWVYELVDPGIRRQACSAHPLRVDACALTDEGWLVLEVKPEAGYQALGQILTYWFYGPQCCGCLAGCGAGVVTNRVQPCIAPVFGHFGVAVFEVGEVVSVK